MSRTATEQQLRNLAQLRRVRDRIDREYAQPLDVEALARGANMSAGHLSREFREAYGEARRHVGDRHLFRGRLFVAGDVQHTVHRAGRQVA